MTTKTTDKAQIRAVIEEWADALRNKDANRMLSHCAPNLVHFSLAPPLLSTASNAEGLNAWFATWQGPIGYEIRDPGIMIGDDVAFSHSLNRMHGTKTDGAKADLWFRQTFAFQRIKGEWKMAHEHESVPFYMDGSFKAAIDLKP
jgi:PhnB protein